MAPTHTEINFEWHIRCQQRGRFEAQWTEAAIPCCHMLPEISEFQHGFSSLWTETHHSVQIVPLSFLLIYLLALYENRPGLLSAPSTSTAKVLLSSSRVPAHQGCAWYHWIAAGGELLCWVFGQKALVASHTGCLERKGCSEGEQRTVSGLGSRDGEQRGLCEDQAATIVSQSEQYLVDVWVIIGMSEAYSDLAKCQMLSGGFGPHSSQSTPANLRCPCLPGVTQHSQAKPTLLQTSHCSPPVVWAPLSG